MHHPCLTHPDHLRQLRPFWDPSLTLQASLTLPLSLPGAVRYFASPSLSGMAALYSLLALFSKLLSQDPHWASGKTNPPPCLPFRLSSWLTSSGKAMPQPPFDPKSSWNRVRLAGCCALSPYHLSFGRLVGCAPFKPSAVTIFWASLFNLVPRTWLGPSGKLKHQWRLPFRGLSLTQAKCSVCLCRSASRVLGSLPDHPSMAQVGKRQRPWGGKSLFYLCMTIMLTIQYMCCYWGKWNVVYKASPPIPFSLTPIDKPSSQWVCIMTQQERVKWDYRSFPTGWQKALFCLCWDSVHFSNTHALPARIFLWKLCLLYSPEMEQQLQKKK